MFASHETTPHASHAACVADTCLLEALRSSGLRAYFSDLCTDDALLLSTRGGAESLVSLIDAQPRCRAQLLFASPDHLRKLADRDTWVLIPMHRGWLLLADNRVTVSYIGQASADVHRGFDKLALLDASQDHMALVVDVDVGLDLIRRRSKSEGKVWQRLINLLRLERREIWSLFVYSILLGGLSLAVPTAVQILVNSIAMAQLIQPLVVLAVILFAVLLLDGATKLLRAYTAEVLARRLFVRIAEDFCARIPNLDPGTQDPFDLGERSQRFFETITIQKSLEVLVVDGFGLVLSTAAGLSLLAFYHPLLLAFDAALILGFVLVAVAGRGALVSAELESRSKYRVAAWIREVALHPDHFHRPAGQYFAQERASELISDYLRSRKIHYRKLFRQLLSGVGIYALAMVVLLGLGGYLVMRGELSLGQLVAAEIVVGMVVKGFTKVGKHLEKLYDLHAALGKVGMVVDLPVRERSSLNEAPKAFVLAQQTLGQAAVPLESSILRRGCHYEFRSQDAQALMSLRAGLMGYRIDEQQRPLQVKLSFEDRSPSPASGEQLANSVFLLEQPRWSEMSLLDRLRLEDPSIHESDALDLLQRVELADWVRSLPCGLHSTPMQIRSELTPTRRAALLLARAILNRPALLIVGDWLESSLIADSERARLEELLARNLAQSALVEFVHDSEAVGSISLRELSMKGAV